MKTEEEIKSVLETETTRRDKILAELNASIGRIQALQAVLSSDPSGDTPATSTEKIVMVSK